MSAKKKTWFASFLMFLSILGPGIITGSVDNDAGGITTYSVAGATYGYKMLWILIPCFVVLFVVQEMNARMGIVTGKGLADLIRENFGVKITAIIFLGLIIADIGNTATEFAGVAGSLQVFDVSKYISVPLAAIAVWVIVVKGNYKSSEKMFLLFSVFLLSYIGSALLSHPDWNSVKDSIIHPQVENNVDFISLGIGMVGTTIAPWMQFYMQSAVIEKRITIADYKYAFYDVLVGCIITVVVAFFIIVACAATLHTNGVQIEEAKDAAIALKPLAGAFASEIFAFGLFIASIFSATILPLATAFYICEAFGFEAGIDKQWDEAPQFYVLFTSILIISVGIILIPGAPLIQISLWSQVINGILLPIVLLCMILMVNNKEIMGEHVNTGLQNSVGWVTVIVLLGLTTILTLEPIITAFIK
jgi:Mn2+ and Fe2+ transporters of the NRAMP family